MACCYEDEFEDFECPTPCPRCGKVVELDDMHCGRTAKSKAIKLAYSHCLLCETCWNVVKPKNVYLMGGLR